MFWDNRGGSAVGAEPCRPQGNPGIRHVPRTGEALPPGREAGLRKERDLGVHRGAPLGRRSVQELREGQ